MPAVIQLLRPTTIPSEESFGSVQLNTTIYPGTISSAESFGPPVVYKVALIVHPSTAILEVVMSDGTVLSNVSSDVFRAEVSGSQLDESGAPITQQHVVTGLEPQADPQKLPRHVTGDQHDDGTGPVTTQHVVTGLEPQADPQKLFRRTG